MKKTWLQNVKIAVFGILTVLLLVLTVLEILPEQKVDVTLKEPIAVSAVLVDTSRDVYENAISGVIFNDSKNTITLDSITVAVSKRGSETEIEIPLSLTLAPHMQEDILFSYFDTVGYTQVDEVTAKIDGNSYSLSNAQSNLIGATVLILLGALFLFGFLLYRSILVRYYMYEEKKLTEQAQ